jgi:hypothetical protein
MPLISGLEAGVPAPTSGNLTLDLFVENTARINFGHAHHFLQQKGLPAARVTLSGEPVNQFEIIAAEFKGNWIKGYKLNPRAGLDSIAPNSNSTFNPCKYDILK